MRILGHEQRVAFAQELRAARATALRDAEAFEEHLFVLERLGSYLSNSPDGSLGRYQSALTKLAEQSPLALEAERRFPAVHLKFSALYDEARVARNDAMHHGAIARHLARHAQELALIMEDSLMSDAKTVRDFMVRNPVCAELWQPLSAIRRTMLLNAFSYLPFQGGAGEWRFISDAALVTFFRSSGADRRERLLMILEEAIVHGLKSSPAQTCSLNKPIIELAKSIHTAPHLVLDDDGKRVLGLITAFDLL